MPPSPRLKATLDEAAYARACAELNIAEPPRIVIRPDSYRDRTSRRTVYGLHTHHTNTITLFLGGITKYQADKLRWAQGELVDTLLHELRHAYQHRHNPKILENDHACETDAEGWAKRRKPDYRNIIRLSRTFPNNGFSRLSRHTVRQDV